MSAPGGGPRPPRLAEALLRRIVGSDAEGRTILGDAREELDASGRAGRLERALWYWTYVLRFALGYGRGARRPQKRPAAGGRLVAWSWDARSSVRALLRRPGLSFAVGSTLAVGIGTTTLAFALVDGVLLRPLPYPEPEALVDVSRVSPEWFGPNPTPAQAAGTFGTPPATLRDWQRLARSFSALGAYSWASATFTGDAAPARIEGAVATGGVFEALGVPAALGRPIAEGDDLDGAQPVVLLSHELWAGRFGSDPDVVGSTVRMDGVPTTVVGVMPNGFTFPDETTRYWVPLGGDRTDPMRVAGFLHGIGRLAPGVTLDAARAELAAIQLRLAETYADEADFLAVAYSRHELMVAAVRPGLLLLLGAAAVVLLVSCANVANLLLTRVAGRRRELALHAALGAGRGRLAAMLLTESSMLALLGGVGGVALAWVAVGPFVSAFPMALPRAAEIQMDLRVVAAAFVASSAIGVLLGLLPVLRSGRLDLNGVLRDGGHGSAGTRGGARTRGLVVVSEVALSVLLLSVSGVFVESYLNAASQDRGFEPDHVLTLRVSLPESRTEDWEEVRVTFREMLADLEAIPGVETAALANQMPYLGCCSSPPASVRTNTGVEQAAIHTSMVTPGYFEALGIPVVAGRGIESSDRRDSAPVAVVSQAMADRYWPGQDPIGRQVRLETANEPVWHEVVGVVGNVRYRFGGGEMVQYYRPFEQAVRAGQSVLLRTPPGAPGVAEAAVRAVHAIESTVAVTVRPLTSFVESDRAYRSARIGALILLVLAAVATGLAVLGVYSVLAHGVLERTREIGIRVSLGGGRPEILRAVLGGGLLMSAVGIAVGLGLAVVAARFLQSGLVGVEGFNPWVSLAVVGVMLATSVIACSLPAVRALRVNPVVALKED